MLKFILKVWPAFLPITIYLIWVFLIKRSRKKDYIDAEYKVVNEKSEKISAFSLRNSAFVLALFSTLILIILSLIFIVITSKPVKQINERAVSQEIIIE